MSNLGKLDAKFLKPILWQLLNLFSKIVDNGIQIIGLEILALP